VSGYQTIVIDPPWDMKRGSQYSWREGRASGQRRELDYERMSLEQIAGIGVEALAAPDAHLFCWTTGTFLEATYPIVRGWGFAPSQTLIWCKEPHGWGPGGVFQATAEFIVYARRGQPEPSAASTIDRQWWVWPRGEHSAKPDAFLDMLEAKFPEPRVELFARRARLSGWDYAGDEALATVAVAGLR
jgi:N6-adenosine-specific RNA methylase IME4